MKIDTIPESLKSNLMYMRGQRDALARQVVSAACWWLDDDAAIATVDKITTWSSAASAKETLSRGFCDRRNYQDAEKLETLYLMSRHVHLLEKQICGHFLDRYELHDLNTFATAS